MHYEGIKIRVSEAVLIVDEVRKERLRLCHHFAPVSTLIAAWMLLTPCSGVPFWSSHTIQGQALRVITSRTNVSSHTLNNEISRDCIGDHQSLHELYPKVIEPRQEVRVQRGGASHDTEEAAQDAGDPSEPL